MESSYNKLKRQNKELTKANEQLHKYLLAIAMDAESVESKSIVYVYKSMLEIEEAMWSGEECNDVKGILNQTL